jgi:hypothetical protein
LRGYKIKRIQVTNKPTAEAEIKSQNLHQILTLKDKLNMLVKSNKLRRKGSLKRKNRSK